jgi:hypothetical protein
MTHPRRLATLIVAIGLLAGASVVLAAGTPAQKCQAGKNKTAAKYAGCRQNAAAKLATAGDVTKYGDALTKCGTKFIAAWQKLDAKAAVAGATCPDGPGTEGQFQTVIDEHTENVKTALEGGGLQDCPADLGSCETNLAACTGGAPQGRPGRRHRVQQLLVVQCASRPCGALCGAIPAAHPSRRAALSGLLPSRALRRAPRAATAPRREDPGPHACVRAAGGLWPRGRVSGLAYALLRGARARPGICGRRRPRDGRATRAVPKPATRGAPTAGNVGA